MAVRVHNLPCVVCWRTEFPETTKTSVNYGLREAVGFEDGGKPFES
jgi:hypothetical protein